MYAVDAESEVQMCGGGNRHVGIHRSEGAGKCRIACLKHRAKPSQEFQSLLFGLISALPGSSPRMQLLSSSCSFLLLSSKKRERLWRHRIDARRRDIISNNTRCPLPQHKIPLPPSIYLAIIIHCVEQHKTNFEQHKAGPTRFLTLTFQTYLFVRFALTFHHSQRATVQLSTFTPSYFLSTNKNASQIAPRQ